VSERKLTSDDVEAAERFAETELEASAHELFQILSHEAGKLERRAAQGNQPTANQPIGSEPDLLSWAKVFLPTHFTREPSLMHRWLAEQLDDMVSRRGTKLNNMASITPIRIYS
jgi:hypothetical protein